MRTIKPIPHALDVLLLGSKNMQTIIRRYLVKILTLRNSMLRLSSI